jgi:hypothetical protein
LDAKTQRRKVENTGKILIAADHPMGEPETEHDSWFSLRLCAFASKEPGFLGSGDLSLHGTKRRPRGRHPEK